MKQRSKGSHESHSQIQEAKKGLFFGGARGSKDRIETIVTQMVEPLVEAMGLELVEVNYLKEGPNWYLRIFIDRPEGVDLDICQALSNKIEPVLDEADLISQAYYLEVSSPGLERPLKKEADFQRYQGNKIRVTTYAAIEGKKVMEGTLKGLSNGQIMLEWEDRVISVPLNMIASARLAVDFD